MRGCRRRPVVESEKLASRRMVGFPCFFAPILRLFGSVLSSRGRVEIKLHAFVPSDCFLVAVCLLLRFRINTFWLHGAKRDSHARLRLLEATFRRERLITLGLEWRRIRKSSYKRVGKRIVVPLGVLVKILDLRQCVLSSKQVVNVKRRI